MMNERIDNKMKNADYVIGSVVEKEDTSSDRPIPVGSKIVSVDGEMVTYTVKGRVLCYVNEFWGGYGGVCVGHDATMLDFFGQHTPDVASMGLEGALNGFSIWEGEVMFHSADGKTIWQGDSAEEDWAHEGTFRELTAAELSVALKGGDPLDLS